MLQQKLFQPIVLKNANFFLLYFFSNPISLSSVQFLAPRSPCHIHKVANLTLKMTRTAALGSNNGLRTPDKSFQH